MVAAIRSLNWKVTVPAVVMALAFMLIHGHDAKFFWPVLLWMVAGVLLASIEQSAFCLLVLLSWGSLWLMAFYPKARKGWLFLVSSGFLWLVVIWLIGVHSGKPLDYRTLWFWVPMAFFAGSSLKLFNWFFITSKLE